MAELQNAKGVRDFLPEEMILSQEMTLTTIGCAVKGHSVLRRDRQHAE